MVGPSHLPRDAPTLGAGPEFRCGARHAICSCCGWKLFCKIWVMALFEILGSEEDVESLKILSSSSGGICELQNVGGGTSCKD